MSIRSIVELRLGAKSLVALGVLGIVLGLGFILHGVGAFQIGRPGIFALTGSLLIGLLFVLFGFFRIVRALRVHPKRWLERPAGQGRRASAV